MADFDKMMMGLARVNCYQCRYDRGFSYYLYVPGGFEDGPPARPYHLVVVVHGAERSAEVYRNKLKKFAEQSGSVVLAPMFPALGWDMDSFYGYRYLRRDGVEYDTILLKMIGEVAEKVPVEAGKIFLYGFSAGGQFVHRFFYVHPEILRCATIGSTGFITPIDPGANWPEGTGDLETVFGRGLDLEKMRRVPLQLVVGDQDLEPVPLPGGRGLGTRLDIANLLMDNYRGAGLNIRLELVPGVEHNGVNLLDQVTAFFAEHM